MKVKTNLRAGAGKPAVSTDPAASASSSTSSGGANAGGVNSNKPVYVPPVYYGRCVGI